MTHRVKAKRARTEGPDTPSIETPDDGGSQSEQPMESTPS